MALSFTDLTKGITAAGKVTDPTNVYRIASQGFGASDDEILAAYNQANNLNVSKDQFNQWKTSQQQNLNTTPNLTSQQITSGIDAFKNVGFGGSGLYNVGKAYGLTPETMASYGVFQGTDQLTPKTNTVDGPRGTYYTGTNTVPSTITNTQSPIQTNQLGRFGSLNEQQYGELYKSLNDLLTNPDSFKLDPGYQASLKLGLQELNRNQATKGLLGSGNRLFEITDYASDVASKAYNERVKQLTDLLGLTSSNTISSLGKSGDQALTNRGLDINSYSAIQDAVAKGRSLDLAEKSQGFKDYLDELRYNLDKSTSEGRLALDSRTQDQNYNIANLKLDLEKLLGLGRLDIDKQVASNQAASAAASASNASNEASYRRGMLDYYNRQLDNSTAMDILDRIMKTDTGEGEDINSILSSLKSGDSTTAGNILSKGAGLSGKATNVGTAQEWEALAKLIDNILS